MIVALAHPELDLLSTETSAERFDAIERRVAQAMDAAREAKESTRGSFDLLVARLGQRTNDIMKVLTLVTVILLPATVLAGVMGMNFQLDLFDLVVDVLGRDRRDARHRRARALGRPQSTLDLIGSRRRFARRHTKPGSSVGGEDRVRRRDPHPSTRSSKVSPSAPR